MGSPAKRRSNTDFKVYRKMRYWNSCEFMAYIHKNRAGHGGGFRSTIHQQTKHRRSLDCGNAACRGGDLAGSRRRELRRAAPLLAHEAVEQYLESNVAKFGQSGTYRR